MPHPKSSAGYEDAFSLLFNILSDENYTGETIRLSFSSEKEAMKFRLKYYSFRRTLRNEAQEFETRGIIAHEQPLIDKGQLMFKQLAQSQKFEIRIEDKDVIASDRNIGMEALDGQLLNILSRVKEKPSTSQTSLPRTMEELLAQSPRTPKNTDKDLDPLAEATQPPPTGISANALCANIGKRLEFGEQAEFNIPFSSETEAQDFIERLWKPFTSTYHFPHEFIVNERYVIFRKTNNTTDKT